MPWWAKWTGMLLPICCWVPVFKDWIPKVLIHYKLVFISNEHSWFHDFCILQHKYCQLNQKTSTLFCVPFLSWFAGNILTFLKSGWSALASTLVTLDQIILISMLCISASNLTDWGLTQIFHWFFNLLTKMQICTDLAYRLGPVCSISPQYKTKDLSFQSSPSFLSRLETQKP